MDVRVQLDDEIHRPQKTWFGERHGVIYIGVNSHLPDDQIADEAAATVREVVRRHLRGHE